MGDLVIDGASLEGPLPQVVGSGDLDYVTLSNLGLSG